MKKAEFLSLLQESLEGNITRADMEENIKYYSRYFDESRKSEEEVCEELGDPRLIARTVIDACIASKGPMAEHYRSQVRSEIQGMQRGYSGSGYGDSMEEEYVQMTMKDKLLRILIVLAIIVCLIIIAKAAIAVFFKIVLPLIIIFMIIALAAKLFNGSGGGGGGGGGGF